MTDLARTRHPWNVDFTWTAFTGPFQILDDGQVVALTGDPAAGPAVARELCDHSGRQYDVLRDGRPVDAP